MPRHTNLPASRRIVASLAALALIALGVMFGAASASADAPYSITGTIADTTGSGIGDLSLSLYDSTSTLVDTESTAADGTFTFAGLVDGTYTIVTTGSTGYVAIHATATVADADFVLNVTDPRYGTMTGVITAGAAPLSGVRVKAFDSATNAGYDADGPADASGAFSITLPATTGSYTFYFSNSVGVRLPIGNYNFGGGAVATSNACMLTAGVATVAGLAAGNPITVSVTLNSDTAPCGAAAPTPSASASASPHHKSTLLAQTGDVVVATPTPSATADPNSSKAGVTTFTAPAELKPTLTPTSSTGPMPGWGWLLVGLAVLAMLGGVGFTVVRHR